ncbi:hypothetical protein MMC26_005776 [Xylographa opegraphella]|nr:hypothetical protein [Xylographa opegraphella]
MTHLDNLRMVAFTTTAAVIVMYLTPHKYYPILLVLYTKLFVMIYYCWLPTLPCPLPEWRPRERYMWED